jgi:ABC-type transport system involved in multi-copper enzyme maturation permease subunit
MWQVARGEFLPATRYPPPTTIMTELTQKPSKKRFKPLRQNPVTMKELRSRMRGRRAFVVLTLYLLAMSIFVVLIYAGFAASSGGPYGPNARDAGKAVFMGVLSVEVFLVIFVGPSFTVGAVSGEKERQTFDLLRTTLLTGKSLVTGKLISALSYVFLLLIASIPLQSVAFLLGGISGLELIVSQVVVFMAAVTFAMWGLYCSSIMRSTQAASVMTFAGALFLIAGIPFLVSVFGIFSSPILAGISLGWVGEVILLYGALLLAAVNLPATLIVSDIILVDEDAIFFFDQSFGGASGGFFWFPSPWWLFIILYMLLALLLYWLSVRKVRKIANQ